MLTLLGLISRSVYDTAVRIPPLEHPLQARELEIWQRCSFECFSVVIPSNTENVIQHDVLPRFIDSCARH